VANHAAHGAPTLTLGERSPEGESCAFQITVVFMQAGPIVMLELTKL
jgi:hypothetical protein